MNNLEHIKKSIENLHGKFLELKNESDEAHAFLCYHMAILTAGEIFKIMRIREALKETPALGKWFSSAYTRADKILYRKYLETCQNA